MQNKFRKAFTLIELLIVIAIIAILTVAFLPGALKAPAKARDAGRVKAINDIAAALESYSAEHNSVYPAGATVAPFCLDETVTTLKSLASYFPGDQFPRDSVAQKSCDDTKSSLFLYSYDTTDKFYVVAAKMEVKASANSTFEKSELAKTDLTPATIKAGVGADPLKNDGYYVMYGPK